MWLMILPSGNLLPQPKDHDGRKIHSSSLLLFLSFFLSFLSFFSFLLALSWVRNWLWVVNFPSAKRPFAPIRRNYGDNWWMRRCGGDGEEIIATGGWALALDSKQMNVEPFESLLTYQPGSSGSIKFLSNWYEVNGAVIMIFFFFWFSLLFSFFFFLFVWFFCRWKFFRFLDGFFRVSIERRIVVRRRQWLWILIGSIGPERCFRDSRSCFEILLGSVESIRSLGGGERSPQCLPCDSCQILAEDYCDRCEESSVAPQNPIEENEPQRPLVLIWWINQSKRREINKKIMMMKNR